MKRLTPLVVLVTDSTRRALDDYVTATEAIIRNDSPEVESALDAVQVNGWTPTMLIAGGLLAQVLEVDDRPEGKAS